MAEAETIAIVGAGFSGALLAVQLLRRTDRRVLLIDRSGRFGPGLAYSTTTTAHVLNVRSGRMSAFPDEPDDFARWLAIHRPEEADPDGFAPRATYGAYLTDTLERAAAAAPGRLERITGEVVSVEADDHSAWIKLADRRAFTVSDVVLALGNPPPGAPEAEGLADAPSDRYIADPWAPGALASIKPADEVLLLGAGLTMIDVVLALDAGGWLGRALALSRRGLLPRSHDPAHTHPAGLRLGEGPLSQRLRQFRELARTRPWGEVMDAIRPHNQTLWREASGPERRRFLRHLRPWWDVHRHRTAPEVSARIASFQAGDRLAVAAGRVIAFEAGSGGVWVEWRPRGEDATTRMRFDRAVNCTGPLVDLTRSDEPLVLSLFDKGLARPGSCRMGLDVDVAGRVVDGDGRLQPRLHALGPVTRGTSWETVAVPEIRHQAAALARALAPATVA